MSARVLDDSYAIQGCSAELRRSDLSSGHWYFDGVVRTPDGYVSVYTQHGLHPLTNVSFVKDSRLYLRTWKGRSFSSRGLAIIAGRFAREISQR